MQGFCRSADCRKSEARVKSTDIQGALFEDVACSLEGGPVRLGPQSGGISNFSYQLFLLKVPQQVLAQCECYNPRSLSTVLKSTSWTRPLDAQTRTACAGR